jgi:hypothetical protein
MKTLFNFFYNLLMIVLISAVLVAFSAQQWVVVLIAAALFVYMFIPSRKPRAGLPAEVVRRLFTSDLQQVLYPDNAFYKGAQKDEAGIDVETVEIPQDEDGEAEVVVNPTQLPLPIGTEEDKKKEYGADLLVTKPTVVTYNNQLLVSYDKRAAKLKKHRMSLERQIAERILYGWAPSAAVADFIRQTTGVATRAASAPGATGTRKVAVEADWRWASHMFDKLDIPDDGRRRVVVPPGMKQDIWDVMKDYGQGTDVNNFLRGEGKLGKLFGFEVFMRSTTQRFTEAATPVKKAIGAANATTDNVGAIFFHLDFVRYIEGAVQVWMDQAPRPELAGGMSMNAGVRSGGTTSRLSQKGVLALVEDN